MKNLPWFLAFLVVFGAFLAINGDFSPAKEPEILPIPIQEVNLLDIENSKACNTFCNCNCNKPALKEKIYRQPIRNFIKSQPLKRTGWRILHPFDGRFRCR